MTETLSSSKYIIFFLTLMIGVPLGYNLGVRFPRVEKVIFFLMLFFTAKMEDINFVSRETYRLTSKGFEIGMVDIATMIIFLIVLHRRYKYRLQMPPGSIFYFLYVLFSIVSIINAAVPLFSLFEVWKMVRMYFYFWVLYNYLNDFEKFEDLLRSIAIIVLYIFEEVFRQKYIYYKFQSPGPFPHQNSLVMYMLVFASLVFAYLMNKKDVRPRNFILWLLLFGLSTVTVISTLSRAGMVLFGMSCILIISLSFGAGLTTKKLWVTGILVVLTVAILIKSWDSINERFQTAPEESANTRVNLATAALNMANDKFLGVGLNNFGIKINPPYSYGSHIEMRNPDDEEEKNGLVETVYLMIAAECGWITMGIYFLLLFYFFFMNLRNYFAYAGSDYQFVSIGLIGGLIGIYIESGLEWVLKQTNNFYQLMMAFAIIGAMYKIERSYYSRKVKLPARRETLLPETIQKTV